MSARVDAPSPARPKRPVLAEPRPGARRLPWIALGVLLVAGSGLVFSVWAASLQHRRSVLALGRSIHAGDVVRAVDLQVVGVDAEPGAGLIGAEERAVVAGRRAAADLPAGTLLHDALLQNRAPVLPGEAVVAVALGPGAAPVHELRPGDAVMAVEGPAGADDQNDPAALPSIWGGRVLSVVDDPTSEGRVIVSLRVGEVDAPAVAAAAGADRLRLVLVSDVDRVRALLGAPTTGGRPGSGSTVREP